MAATAPTRRTKAVSKPAPEPEVVEDEFEDMDEDDTETTVVITGETGEDDDDLEELDEDEEPAEAPKTKAKSTKPKTAKQAAPKAPAIEFGSPWLAAHVTEVTGETYDSRAIRMLLRKLANDGKLNRKVGEDRNRYQFTGPEDETVLAVVEMITSGKAKELKQAGLQAVKDKAAEKKAAAKKAKEEAAEAEDATEDGDEEDMEEVEEAPKPTRRRTATPKPSAPAKATPARRKAPITTKG